jgi:hypothetical protein
MGKGFTRRGIVVNRCVPSMCLQKAMNVRGTGEANIIAGLEDVHAIEFRGKAFINKGGVFFIGLLESFTNASVEVFGHGKVGGSKEEAVNLLEE